MNKAMLCFFILAAGAFNARAETSSTKVKFCLAAIYDEQQQHLKRHGQYTNDRLALFGPTTVNMPPASYCLPMKISIGVPKKNRFSATVTFDKVVGTVDESKTIKLK